MLVVAKVKVWLEGAGNSCECLTVLVCRKLDHLTTTLVLKCPYCREVVRLPLGTVSCLYVHLLQVLRNNIFDLLSSGKDLVCY